MIESFFGKNRSLLYGMVVIEMLDKAVDQLENARKVYLNPSQHITGITTIRIGYTVKDGEWVKTEKQEKPQKKRKSEGLSATDSQDDLVVQGIADLKLGLLRVETNFAKFKEEVRADLQNLHQQQEEISS